MGRCTGVAEQTGVPGQKEQGANMPAWKAGHCTDVLLQFVMLFSGC